MTSNLRRRLLVTFIAASTAGIASIVGTHRVQEMTPAQAVAVGDVAHRGSVEDAAAEVLGSINSLRAAAGLQLLDVDPCLGAVAAEWELYLETSPVLASRSGAGMDLRQALDGHCPGRWLAVGGNVGAGPTRESVVAAYMDQAATRDNVLDPAYTHVGVAIGRRPGDARELIIVIQFGAAP